MELLIANKNYSSWSLRPWLVMRHFGLPFEERQVWLGQDDTAEQIAAVSPSGRVPCLVDGTSRVWDSLAIVETLAERFPQHPLWPRDADARAWARAVSAEMHSGFTALRQAMPMNVHATGFAGRVVPEEVRADIARIEALLAECLAASGGPFLFGDFSIADAMYAPVALRFETYRPTLSATTQAYVQRLLALPALQQWVEDARVEGHRLARYDVLP
ncbi:glutathione S-transferase family protein [Chitinasiproducens palmae]|uniref:Glutathione S-transferase n=1 Tax=Chitinasiproducens palmae TaxID=1770053 RepID=A0A1H2PTA1_9BURK|nr:glutathione S-transferase family protein [Chitinasiproducens palmae]SDV50329.1 glutathione S-transferase [Chitinasiproducens palmae]